MFFTETSIDFSFQQAEILKWVKLENKDNLPDKVNDENTQ